MQVIFCVYRLFFDGFQFYHAVSRWDVCNQHGVDDFSVVQLRAMFFTTKSLNDYVDLIYAEDLWTIRS